MARRFFDMGSHAKRLIFDDAIEGVLRVEGAPDNAVLKARTIASIGGHFDYDGSTVSGSNTGDVTIVGENYLSLSGQQITANEIDISEHTNLAVTTPIVLTGDTLSHADTAVTPGTYSSVTVDQKGHITAGTNPGFIDGSGSANAIPRFTDSNTLAASRITDTGSGDITISTEISADANTDGTHTFGRTRIGSVAADTAAFGHFDQFNSTNYALIQQAGGNTVLNSPAGGVVSIAINNSALINISSTTIQLNQAQANLDTSISSDTVVNGLLLDANGGAGNGHLELNVPLRCNEGYSINDPDTILIDANGNITITEENCHIRVDGASNPDNLDGILGGRNGQVIYLQIVLFGDAINVRHNSASAGGTNFINSGAATIALGIFLRKYERNNYGWCQVA